jgi:hypothetical protein
VQNAKKGRKTTGKSISDRKSFSMIKLTKKPQMLMALGLDRPISGNG